MKLLFTILCIPNLLLGAFCNTATNYGVLTPTSTMQTTAPVGNGQRPYWTFTATAGCTYVFETCGLTGMDTELEILQGVGGTPLLYNDDACGLQSRLTWVAPTTGTFTIFMTRMAFPFTCRLLNNNVRLSYREDCIAILPVELIYFEGHKKDGVNVFKWEVASKINHSHFNINKSYNNKEFKPLLTIASSDLQYSATDIESEGAYYQLEEISLDGISRIMGLVYIQGTDLKIISITNLLGQAVLPEEEGFLIIVYSDGSIKKIFK
jgi:hypothetical protein